MCSIARVAGERGPVSRPGYFALLISQFFVSGDDLPTDDTNLHESEITIRVIREIRGAPIWLRLRRVTHFCGRSELVAAEGRDVLLSGPRSDLELQKRWFACIRKARQDESNKGDARSEAVITGCNEDEAALNVKLRSDEDTVRRAEMAWQKVNERHNIMLDAFNRLSSPAEIWKRADLDAAPVVAMNKTITAASATVKESADTCIEQVKALVVDMEAKVQEIKAKYAAPAAAPAAGN